MLLQVLIFAIKRLFQRKNKKIQVYKQNTYRPIRVAAPDSRSSSSLRSPRPSMFAHHMTDELRSQSVQGYKQKEKHPLKWMLFFLRQSSEKSKYYLFQGVALTKSQNNKGCNHHFLVITTLQPCRYITRVLHPCNLAFPIYYI